MKVTTWTFPAGLLYLRCCRIVLFLAALGLLTAARAQNPWVNPSYQKGDVVILAGSGALSRHLDPKYVTGGYNHYSKSPNLFLGVDYCFKQTSEVCWGIGGFVSGFMGSKSLEWNNQAVQKNWYSVLIAARLSHHNRWFIKNKFDLCSGYILGVRSKAYHQITINDQVRSAQAPSYTVAAGISATAKYYVYKNMALYCEAALGYQLDVFHFGIVYRIR
ncbi:MAG: hypothetical protein K0R26_2234 [Bacteroidota bacterium]|nr:hypothetical protein [Bacteroidota bacterium]